MRHFGFFGVGRDTFHRACRLGVNEASVFLVLASGTGEDNRVTRWSAEAAANRLSVRWTTAKAAIDSLRSHQLLKVTKGGTRPTYTLHRKASDPLIWLPNTLVDGVGDMPSPVGQVRHTEDPMTLRMLVDFYDSSNLAEDGGISSTLVRQTFEEREKIGQQGRYTAWRFAKPQLSVSWAGDVTKVHYREPTPEEQAEGQNTAVDFFRRFGDLDDIGLIEWIPTIWTAEKKGEPIHSVARASSIEHERRLYAACAGAAERLLTEGQLEYAQSKGGVLVPVKTRVRNVALIAVARLRLRPHTKLTAAWWGQIVERTDEYIVEYERIGVDAFDSEHEGVA